MEEKVTLSGVPETMLQTVYARAKETKTRGAIRDEKAVELVQRLDYDFSLADKDTAMRSGVYLPESLPLNRLPNTIPSPTSIIINVMLVSEKPEMYIINGLI